MLIWLHLGTRAIAHNDLRSLLYVTSSSMPPNAHYGCTFIDGGDLSPKQP
jgi:hypothetical protein